MKNLLVVTLVLMFAVLTGCTTQTRPVVDSVKNVKLGDRPSVDPNTPTQPAISVTAVLNKSAVLGQEFLYGYDIQYSSIYDKDYDLYQQSLALGHIPATFRVAGDELQLVADNRRLFPSDVNHPEQILSRFKILGQTAATITVNAGRSEVFLTKVVDGKVLRDSWVRSFEFVESGSYILQQSSVMIDDGVIIEYMESIMPRATLSPGSTFEQFVMDPDDAVGGSDGVVGRFRLLPGEKIFHGEQALALASHYDISPLVDGTPSTIDWYVTKNIPDEYLAPVQQAIEGWNRYFLKEKGIDREVVKFKGRLPDGIYLGDPRYNVVNWDSRLVAGAAYESQASDPETGKQSHSLIYMPAAWVKIGTDYWKSGQFSEGDGTAPRLAAFKNHSLACLRDMRSLADEAQSGRLSQDEIKTFGIQLLKQTLFHEVGHAMGLNHNFKGSLSYEPSKKDSMFSTSIMDYNDFEFERKAFSSVDSADGPQLEYDRQAIDAIYNKQKDIAATDSVLPTCNDAEADSEDGGVDPLCIRYDLEKDPTQSVNTAWNRLTQPDLVGDVSLSAAIQKVPTLVLTDEVVQAVADKDGFSTLSGKTAAAFQGALRFYIVTGRISVSRTVRNNVRALLIFKDDILPEGYSAVEMRERAVVGVQNAVNLYSLPAAVKNALSLTEATALTRMSQTPYVKNLSESDAKKALDDTTTALNKSVTDFVKDGQTGLVRMRSLVLASLSRHPKVPFYFGPAAQAQVDYETVIVGLLAQVVGDKLNRTTLERVSAAQALSSYSGRATAISLISSLVDKLTVERAVATDNASREAADAILTSLNGSPTDPSKK